MKTVAPPIYKSLKAAQLFSYILLISIFLLLVPTKAQAAPIINTLNSESELVPLENTFSMTPDNIKVIWNGVDGVENVFNDRGGTAFYIPSKGANGNWSYNDPVEFVFTDNYLGAKEIVITVHVDKIEVTSNHANGWSIPENFRIGSVDSSGGFWFANSTTVQSEVDKFGEAHSQWFIDYTVTITYADTGEIVNQPFFQVVSDIDAGGSSGYFKESWTSGDGFSGTYYIYDKNHLDINGTTFKTPNGGTALDGNDSLIQGGVIGLTKNGQFSSRMELGSCGSQLYLFSSFSSIETPSKSFVLEL